jgi:hypothetical protein
MEGWPPVAHDVVAHREGGDGSVCSKEGDDGRGGLSGPQRLNGTGTRCVNF